MLEMLLELLLQHRGKVLGVLLGLLLGWMLVTRGFWATLLLLLFLVVGYFLGRLVDEEGSFWGALDRLFPPRSR